MNNQQTHILKFLNKQTLPQRMSKRFRPQQTFGHSKQSPDWFKQKFSLQSNKGYQYKFDAEVYKEKFKYLSQKNNFNVNNQDKKTFREELMIKNSVHNRKKGLLSEYLDNNSWMKKVIPLTGFQRNQESRRLNHLDRDKNIETARLKNSAYVAAKTASNFYSTKFSKMRANSQNRQIKTSHDRTHSFFDGNYFQNPQSLMQNSIQRNKNNQTQTIHNRSKSNTLLMGKKQKIRVQRNKAAQNKIHKIQKVKLQDTLITQKFKTIDARFVQQRLAQTTRDWGTGQGNKSKLSTYKSIQRFDQMITQQNSLISNKHYPINRQLFNKKLSSPHTYDIEETLQTHKFVSNQI